VLRLYASSHFNCKTLNHISSLSLRAVLAVSARDEDALQCKVVAQILLGEYAAALATIIKAALPPGGRLNFERVRAGIVTSPGAQPSSVGGVCDDWRA
jgi:hypothetical protein